MAAAAAFEHASHLFVLMEGPELRLVAANRVTRELVGRPLYGLPIREAIPELAGQEVLEQFERAYATGVPETLREWRMLVGDGSGGTVDVYFTNTVVPLRDRAGRVRWLADDGEDVTASVAARRAAEVEAAASEQRYLAAQEIVLILQRNLLPAAVPVVPGVRCAAQYVVAEAELQAGGDWFDTVPLGDGRVALVVGDVVGHGATAAAAMSQLRPVLREALRSGAAPAEAVDRLDAFAADSAATRAATVCVAVLDPADGTLVHVSRAHPAPLVCAPDGRTRFLPDGRGGPLGVGAGPSRTVRGAGDQADLRVEHLDRRSGGWLPRPVVTAGCRGPRSAPDHLLVRPDGTTPRLPESGEQVRTMSVIPLPIATRISVGPQPYTDTAGWAEPRHLATNAAGLVHHETAPLLGALEDAIAIAAARGVNDTGARRAADDLRRARIALDFAITAAGRALADREVRVRRAS